MKKFLSILKTIFFGLGSRAIFVYLLAFLMLWPFSHYRQTLIRARCAALSRYIPDFNYLIKFRDGDVSLEKEQMQDYYNYFRKVNDYMPNKADAISLLGFCAYYLGRDKEALHYYQEAANGYNLSFAYHYNLGVLYYKKGDYQKALTQLQAAVSLNFIENLKFVTSSRVYFPLFKDPNDIQHDLTKYMKLGYEHSYHLLLLSYTHLNQPIEALNISLQALNQPPQDPSFFNFYAGILSVQIRDYRQGIKYLTAYLNQHPNSPDALFSLAIALEKIGQKPLAASILKQAEALKASGANDMPEEKLTLRLY